VLIGFGFDAVFCVSLASSMKIWFQQLVSTCGQWQRGM